MYGHIRPTCLLHVLIVVHAAPSCLDQMSGCVRARVRLVKGSMAVMRRHGQQCNATTHCNHHPLVDYEWWRGTCGSKGSECGVGVERGQEGSSAPWTAQRSL